MRTTPLEGPSCGHPGNTAYGPSRTAVHTDDDSLERLDYTERDHHPHTQTKTLDDTAVPTAFLQRCSAAGNLPASLPSPRARESFFPETKGSNIVQGCPQPPAFVLAPREVLLRPARLGCPEVLRPALVLGKTSPTHGSSPGRFPRWPSWTIAPVPCLSSNRSSPAGHHAEIPRMSARSRVPSGQRSRTV